MKRFLNVSAALILTLFFAAAAIAAEKQATCRTCNTQLNDAEKKFSVTMPKVPGMEGSTFDDIGCAITFRNGECASRQLNFDSNACTFDYNTGEQIPLEKAFFAVGAGVKTPRGDDIAAFKDRTAAEKLVAESGKGSIVKLRELVDLPLK